jgi:ribosomal protein L14E/L6E/L27E
MYLPGDTLGERLKAVEQSDFDTIDKAWEAHKVRNKLAHEGGDFILTQREAKRIIALYKDVFDEFRMI